MGPALLQEETGVPEDPAMFGRVKMDYTLPTCDQGNFNQITARSWKRTLVKVVRHANYHSASSNPMFYLCVTINSPIPNIFHRQCPISSVYLPITLQLGRQLHRRISTIPRDTVVHKVTTH